MHNFLHWHNVVWVHSAGTSSGMVGPFITDVVQVCKQLLSCASVAATETAEAHCAGTCWLQCCILLAIVPGCISVHCLCSMDGSKQAAMDVLAC